MTRNPSELQRQHEESLEDERVFLLEEITHPGHVKSAKENMLRRLRKIEEELGYTSTPYNSSEFGRPCSCRHS